MRKLAAFFALGAVAISTGCIPNWSFLRKSQDSQTVTSATPTAPDLVRYLNQNSQRIQSISCYDVDLEVKQGMQPFGLRAKMACQKPRSFRLVADALGNSQVDLGSNSKEFWYWIAKASPPYLVHCSYEDLARGVPTPFPFQPEWVMETLGMGDYGSAEGYKLMPPKSKSATYELVQQTRAPNGAMVRKVTVFNRGAAHVQVTDHILQDAQGKEICSAHVTDVQQVDGVTIPFKITLNYPAEKVTMHMKLNRPTVNRVTPDLASTLFVRPNLQNVEAMDLAKAYQAHSNSGLRPAGGLVR